MNFDSFAAEGPQHLAERRPALCRDDVSDAARALTAVQAIGTSRAA